MEVISKTYLLIFIFNSLPAGFLFAKEAGEKFAEKACGFIAGGATENADDAQHGEIERDAAQKDPNEAYAGGRVFKRQPRDDRRLAVRVHKRHVVKAEVAGIV